MMRSYLQIYLLIMLVLVSCRAWSDGYDPLLLRAQASIFPKIVLLDKDISKKTTGDKVVFTIVYKEQDKKVAHQFKDLIKDKYRSSLGNKGMVINLTTFEDFDYASNASAYILLQGPKDLFKKVVSHASINNRILFSYSYTDFKYDALISLYVKEKTYIYLNKSSVKLYDISFSPIFYKIAKIVE